MADRLLSVMRPIKWSPSFDGCHVTGCYREDESSKDERRERLWREIREGRRDELKTSTLIYRVITLMLVLDFAFPILSCWVGFDVQVNAFIRADVIVCGYNCSVPTRINALVCVCLTVSKCTVWVQWHINTHMPHCRIQWMTIPVTCRQRDKEGWR